MLSRLMLRKNREILLPCAFAVALIGGMWGVTVTELEDSRQKQLAIAEQNMASIVQALDAHTSRTIRSADQAVSFLKYEYGIRGKQLDIAALLSAGVISGDIFNLYSIVDEHADVVLSSRPFEKVNLADREHIRVHMERDSGQLFISKPVLGRVSGKWSIQLTRRINKPDKSFGGVVVVSVDPYYFTRLYNTVRLGDQGVLSLVGSDGVIRALRTGSSDVIGTDVASSPVFREINSTHYGVMRGRSALDGIERIWAYRQVDDYPLYVVAGTSVEEELKPYYVMRDQVCILAATSSLAVLLFTAVLIWLIKRLTVRREQAIMASRAKTQFLSNMSHELRTPLHGILGYAELLRDDLTDSEHRTFAQYIHDSGMHLLSLVNSLLQLSKIEGGEIELNLNKENIRGFLNQAIHAHGSSAKAKGLDLTLDVATDVPEEMLCDRMKMQQVLNNLIHNAIKFTDAGKVRVAATSDGRNLHITVSDTGCGIEPDAQRAVFERFFQVEPAGGTNTGSGLGLSIVKRLIELMGGTISLQSEPGAGSVFTFTVPFEPAAQAEAR